MSDAPRKTMTKLHESVGGRRHCPDCQEDLPSDAPEGLCPSCLGGMALGGGDEPETYADEVGSASEMVEAAGSSIGPYRLLEKIGEGGFGVVYMAEQREAGRPARSRSRSSSSGWIPGRSSPASRRSGRRSP